MNIPADYWQLDEKDPDYWKPRVIPDIQIRDAALSCQDYELKDFELSPPDECVARGLFHLASRIFG